MGIPLDASLRSYDSKAVSIETQTEVGTVSQTQQQFADEVDVNVILSRFGVSGAMPRVPDGVYGDFSGIESYDDALAVIEAAEAQFMKLPASVREKFQNDPAVLVRMANEMELEEFQKVLEEPAAPVVAAPAVQPPVEPLS